MPNAIRSIVVQRSGVEGGRLETPPDQPDVMVAALPWYAVIAVRCSRVFLQSILGTFTVTQLLVLMQEATPDLWRQARLTVLTAVVTSAFTGAQNLMELLTKIDQKYPEVRG